MMNLDQKRLLKSGGGGRGNPLRVLLIGRDQPRSVELQAQLAPIEGIVVETVPSRTGLSAVLHKVSTRPDVVLADVDPDSSEDLALLRDLRKISGIEDVPIIALTDRASAHAPLRAMRAGADDVLLKPIDLDEAHEVFRRVKDSPRLSRHGAAAPGKAIVFMHLSGGAGATTLAVNSACALARAEPRKKTCLIDLDVQFGNTASLLDLPATSPIQEFIDDPARLDETMLESMMLRHQLGFQVLTAPRSLLPLNAYTVEGIGTLINLAKRQFGFVVLDLPVALAPWTDSVLKSASVVYLVTSMSVPSAHRLSKFLSLLHDEGVDKELPLRIVANRHHRPSKLGNDITVSQFEKATGRNVDFKIPNDYSLISLSHGQGRPAVGLKPNSPFTVALTEMLAADLGKDALAVPKRSLFSFGRT